MIDSTQGNRQSVPYPIRLPVSGCHVILRQPTGAEDLLLLEATGDDTALALELAEHLAWPTGGGKLDWPNLTVTDLDALIMRLRQSVIGDRLRADLTCQSSGCGKRIDIAFGINEYLAHRRPGRPRARSSWTIEPDEEPGWFLLMAAAKKARKMVPAPHVPAGGLDASERSPTPDGPVAFRLPTAADQLAIAGDQQGVDELARRCIRPAGISPRLRRLVEDAMETLAPSLSGDLRGTCPECGAEVIVHFYAREFCLRELRNKAAFLYQDIDLLARRYHWAERDILTMPHVRRTNYAELARQQVL